MVKELCVVIKPINREDSRSNSIGKHISLFPENLKWQSAAIKGSTVIGVN